MSEMIDLTPKGAETTAGRARIQAAIEGLHDVNAQCAGILLNEDLCRTLEHAQTSDAPEVRDVGRDLLFEIREVKRARASAQDEFLCAVGGR